MATQNRYYSNIANVTTLTNSGGISNSGTNLIVGSTTGFPVLFPFILRLEPATLSEEVVLVNSGSGTVGTPYVITRGFDGTAARSHSAGVVVKHGFAQIDFADPQVHLNSVGPGGSPNPHGLPDLAWNNTLPLLITSTTLATTAASVVFNSMGSQYNNLVIKWHARSDSATTAVQLFLQLNGITTSSYLSQDIQGNNNTVTSAATMTTATRMQVGTLPAATATALYWGAGDININGWNDTTNYVPITAPCMAFATSAVANAWAAVYGGMLLSAQTLSSVTLLPASGNFIAGSIFSLYGFM